MDEITRNQEIDAIAVEGDSPAGAAIQVCDVSKKFKVFADRKTNVKEKLLVRKRKTRSTDFWALHDVTFEIPRGKTFGLIGHNGSGKSTLLKLIAGIHRTTSGTIVTHGRISAMLELGAGFHPELSGRENIYLNGSILGMSRKQIEESIDSIIEFSGLEEFIETPVKVYSSGMYVRLGFAIAVNLDPEILIIDEVIAVGDEEFQRKCFDHLYQLRRKGVTIVMVSHGLGVVADLCDEVAWLDGGRLRAVGPAREVINKYLEVVNTRESLQGEASATNAVEGEVNADRAASHRRGSGEVRIISFRSLDTNGVERGFAMSGERTVFELGYEASESLEQVTFGMSFVHESGALLAGPNSGYERAFRVDKGSGVITFEVAELMIQPANFSVSVAAVDKGHTYDYQHEAFTFRVRAANPITEPGMVVMTGSWTSAAE